MITESTVRQWYTPVEVSTLQRWLLVSFVVNIVLLAVDLLRGSQSNAMLGVLGVVVLGLLLNFLPEEANPSRRNIALVLGGALLLIGLVRLLSSPATGFDIWMQGWLVGPGALTLIWVSSRPVSAWSTRRMSLEAIEYGLARNQQHDGRWRSIGAHLVLLHFVALTLLPLVWILDIALSPGNALGGSLGGPYTGEHFSNMLESEAFWTWMRNSLIVSVGTTLMGLIVAVPAGYAFSRYKFTGRDVSMFAFLLVQMFPGIIILVPYFLVMKTLGLLNSHLGLILAYCVTALPLCVWMLKGFFDTVPRELEEAALLDGCTQFQVFTKVVLPLSLPAVAVTALFSFLAAWNEFLLALTFNTSNDMYTLPVGLASMISSTGQAWGDFAAASLLVSLPVALLFLIFQKFLIEGLSAGGVKG
ncbi:MAG: sugar ABC transporter permease [Candidatus Poseidonia sp.]|nr:sugar ABC transporter permease [Poseidonia sp.]